MDAKIKISATTIIISRSEKPSGRRPPVVPCRYLARPMDAQSITTRRQRKLGSGSARAELQLCMSLSVVAYDQTKSRRDVCGSRQTRAAPLSRIAELALCASQRNTGPAEESTRSRWSKKSWLLMKPQKWTHVLPRISQMALCRNTARPYLILLALAVALPSVDDSTAPVAPQSRSPRWKVTETLTVSSAVLVGKSQGFKYLLHHGTRFGPQSNPKGVRAGAARAEKGARYLFHAQWPGAATTCYWRQVSWANFLPCFEKRVKTKASLRRTPFVLTSNR